MDPKGIHVWGKILHTKEESGRYNTRILPIREEWGRYNTRILHIREEWDRYKRRILPIREESYTYYAGGNNRWHRRGGEH